MRFKITCVNFILFFLTSFFYGAEDKIIKLPEVKIEDGLSVGKAILQRRSVRSYSSRVLSLRDISLLLWAAQGITS